MENENLVPAVSVVIPMYNVEKYIGELLDSILAQTFDNFEVIVVNDLSSDNSLAVAKSYIPKFQASEKNISLRVESLEVNSGGASVPRNKGIELAGGEYIFFVDSDDILPPDALERLYFPAKKNDVDILYFTKYYSFHGENLKTAKKILNDDDKKITDVTTVSDCLTKFLQKRFISFPWRYIFRREFILQNKIEFPLMTVGEDRFFIFVAMFFAKKVVSIPNNCYYYRIRPSSLSYKALPPKVLFTRRVNFAFSSIKFLKEFIEKNDFFKVHPEVKAAAFNRFVIGLMDPVVNRNAGKKISESDRMKIICEALENIEADNYLTSFLFNRLVDMSVTWIKRRNQIRRAQKNLKTLQKAKARESAAKKKPAVKQTRTFVLVPK